MKTNVVMERKMGNFKVYQRIKDGFFNATSLLNKWDYKSGQQKQIIHFTENKKTKEFIKALAKEDNLKERNSVVIKTRGKNGGTWMHPLLFIDFAMWLNPTFKVKVLQFVYDQLIEFRHAAGDNYNVLTSAVTKLKNAEYPKVAQALNYIVFGRHAKNLRQRATSAQLDELTTLETKLAFAINMGYIRSYDSLIVELRKIWALKYNPIKTIK